MAVSIFASHPLMLERMRLQLSRTGFEIHAYLLPTQDRLRGFELLPTDAWVIDAYDPELVQQVLVRIPAPRPRLLVVGESFADEFAHSLLFMGVRGLVRYERMASELVRALETMRTGAFWIPRLLLAGFVDRMLERYPHPEAIAPLVRLSSREREVLEGVLSKLANKEIAARLGLSERTVKFHVSNLLRKFGVSGRHNLTMFLLHSPASTQSLPEGAGEQLKDR
ncbi:MAG: LuxR C-terminal-related transcriptional regulator [Terriglobales bacterium]